MRRHFISGFALALTSITSGHADETSIHTSLAMGRSANTVAVAAAANAFLATLDSTLTVRNRLPVTYAEL